MKSSVLTVVAGMCVSATLAEVYVIDAASDRAATAGEIAAIEALGVDDTVQKTGSGKLTYSGLFEFPGTLQIDAGTFALNNPAVVSNRMTLVGSGTFRQEAGNRVVDAYNAVTPNSTSFTGDYVIAGGTNTLVAANSSSIYAKYGAQNTGAIIVDGGTLRIYTTGAKNGFSNMSFARKAVHIKGAGADGKGAIINDEYQNSLFAQLILDGDATVSVCLGPTGYTSQYFNFAYYSDVPYALDLQGHTLTVVDIPNFTLNSNCRVSPDGKILFRNTTTTTKGVNCYPSFNLGNEEGPGDWEFTGSCFHVNDYHFGQTDSFKRPFVLDLNNGGYVSLRPIRTSSWVVVDSDVTFKDTNAGYLTFDSVQQPYNIAVMNGRLTGPGYMRLGSGKGYQELVVNSRTNTLTGGIRLVDGAVGQRLVLTYPDVLADYSLISVKNGQLVVDGANWGASNIFALAREATFNSKALAYARDGVFVSTTNCPNQTATLYVTDAELDASMAAIGHVGEGTLVISGNCATKTLALRPAGGVIKLTGEKVRLGADSWYQTLTPNTFLNGDMLQESKIVIEDAADVSLDGQLQIGSNNNTIPKSNNPLVVSIANSTVHDAGGNSSAPQILLGNYQPAILEVGPGTDLNTTMNVGYGYANAAVYQNGGYVYFRDGNAWGTRAWLGFTTGSCGYYELADGILTNNYIMTIGGGGIHTCGIIVQTGGELAILGSNAQLNLGNNYALGLYDLVGGRAKINSLNFGRGDAGNCHTEEAFVLEGGEAEVTAMQLCNGNTNNLALVTLSGGRLTMKNTPYKAPHAVWTTDGSGHKAGDVWREPEWHKAYLNLNGGVWHHAMTWNGELFQTAGAGSFDRVTVFEGGAGFEVDAGRNHAVNLPLQAPEGMGIASVPWTGDFTTNAFVGPPSVRIIGDGCSAQAIARFDSATRTVTGVEVLAPGTGYSWAKAVFAYGCGSDKVYRVQTNDCVLTATAPTSGGLVKKGAGTLTLNCENTYTGDTVVEAGTLHFGCEGALPAASKLVLKGGRVTAAAGVAIPAVEFQMEIGATQQYDAGLVIPAGSTVTVTGTPQDGVKGYPLATWSGQTQILEWANPEDYPGWNLHCGPNGCRLVRDGMRIIFK